MRPQSRTNWQTGGLCLLLAAATLWVYWPLRLNGFIEYDDQQYLTENREVQQGMTWKTIAWAFTTGHAANWHPLTWVSHALDCQWFGLDAAAHHTVNLLFHVVNSLLLLVVLRRMTGALWPSALVAALFALHPLHVESVAWAAERKDTLSAFFGLLCLWAYAGYVSRRRPCGTGEQGGLSASLRIAGADETSERGRNSVARVDAVSEGQLSWRSAIARGLRAGAWYYALALIWFGLALMSKPMLVTWPFVFLLLDYWPLRRFELAPPRSMLRALAPLIREKLPFFALAAASSAVTFLVQQKAMLYHKDLALPDRAANAVVACVRYLGKAFWPQDLVVIYPHPGRWGLTWVIGAMLVLLVISGWVVWNLRRRPYLGVGWGWFLGMLVPVLGLVQVGVQSMADRYTYLPLIGIFIMGVWIAHERLGARAPAVFGAVALSVVAACSIRTRSQVHFWRDTETVFTHAVAVTRGNWLAHYRLALLALDRYQNTRRVAVADQPVVTGGSAALSQDELRQVIDHCEAALEARARLVEVRVTYAKALVEGGRLDTARLQLETAVRLDPVNAEARQDLAEVLYRQGYAHEAVGQYKAALKLRPDWGSVLNNLAWVLATHPDATVRDGAEAVRLAEHGCRLTGHTNLWYLHTLAAACAERGDFTNAVAAAQRAKQLAEATGQEALSKTARERLSLYESHQALRAP